MNQGMKFLHYVDSSSQKSHFLDLMLRFSNYLFLHFLLYHLPLDHHNYYHHHLLFRHLDPSLQKVMNQDFHGDEKFIYISFLAEQVFLVNEVC